MKKMWTKLGIIFLIFLVTILIFFFIDFIRVRSQQRPLFCIQKQVANDGGTVIYFGMGYKVISFHRIVEGSEQSPVYYEKMEIGSWGMQYEDFEEDYQEFKKSYKLGVSGKEEETFSFYATVLSCTETSLLVEPKEGEEIRKTADKISVNFENNNDMIYPEGTNVKITYTGRLTKSIPPQVSAINIEIKSVEAFELRVNEFVELPNDEPYKILSKEENKYGNYNVYAYHVNVEIEIEGNTFNLRNALLENRITMDEIIKKANMDWTEEKITGESYKDGGSMMYHYDTYNILKCHTVDGNRDVYIGTPAMTIKDVI